MTLASAIDAATPAGVQPMRILARRRLLVLALNLLTFAALNGAVAAVLGAGGWSLVDVLLFACLLVGTPWTVLGFWNSAIGLWLLHGRGGGLMAAAPYAAAADDKAPLRIDTAVLLTLRNEDPERAILRLRTVRDSLEATGEGDRFAYFVLSDTTDLEIAAREEAAVAAWGAERVTYRRRTVNEGYKAGNLRDFCARWGAGFELMLPLDADSLMTGETIVRLVRIMQAHPRIGILQSLVVGMPSQSAFARLFQFGMRQSMRSYTAGHAWWTGDCGPFWGHNALVRIQPFATQCTLPLLPGGAHILSHDQVEAALMRRAGYEVRVLPEECGSWEENPPTLPEFSRRNLRWCQGNLQYRHLLGLPGLEPVSRFQLIWAILMFIGTPAFTLAIALAAAKPLDGETGFPGALAAATYAVFLLMFLTPKLAGLVDVMLTPGGVARYGGLLRFAVSALAEIWFSFMIGAVDTFRITLFMLGLPFGAKVSWSGQARDAHGLGWREAARGLWLPGLFGLAVGLPLLILAPAALAWALPLVAGYWIAIPLAVASASPRVGAWFARHGIAGIPEDFATPPEIARVQARG